MQIGALVCIDVLDDEHAMAGVSALGLAGVVSSTLTLRYFSLNKILFLSV